MKKKNEEGDTEKSWLYEGTKGLFPYRWTSYHNTKWMHWLHLLNEPMSEQTTRAKRNLLIVATVCFVVASGRLSLSKASLSGLEFSWGDSTFAPTILFLSGIYFLVTYCISLVGEYIDRSILKLKVPLRSTLDPEGRTFEYDFFRQSAIHNVRNRLMEKDFKEFLKVSELFSSYERFEIAVTDETKMLSEKYREQHPYAHLENVEKKIFRRQLFVFVKIGALQIVPIIFSVYCFSRLYPKIDIASIF